MVAFHYSNEQWQRIAEAAEERLKLPLNRADREYLDTESNNFQWLHSRTDSKSPDVIKGKKHWARVHVRATELLEALQGVEQFQGMLHGEAGLASALSSTSDTGQADLTKLKVYLQQTAAWAETAARGFPKNRNDRSNKSRSDLINDYLDQLVRFWWSRGGRVGAAPDSPINMFILAAAGPAMKAAAEKLTPNVIVAFLRSRRVANRQGKRISIRKST